LQHRPNWPAAAVGVGACATDIQPDVNDNKE